MNQIRPTASTSGTTTLPLQKTGFDRLGGTQQAQPAEPNQPQGAAPETQPSNKYERHRGMAAGKPTHRRRDPCRRLHAAAPA